MLQHCATAAGQVFYLFVFNLFIRLSREYQRGKYHCTVDLLFDWFGLVCFPYKKQTKNVSSHTADYKPVKQEVNATVILPS
jgi:hypothetical protein